MNAQTLDDVLVYRKALAASDAISALLERQALRRDLALWDQLSRSSSRTPALIAEGFGQLTDRHRASYFANARGSALETITHLRVSRSRRHITAEECAVTSAPYDEIVKMLTAWINYLQPRSLG